MNSSNPKAGAASVTTIDRTDEAFDAAVRKRMHEIGMSERKARFVTAIEFGLLPDGDIVVEDGTDINEAFREHPR